MSHVESVRNVAVTQLAIIINC